MRLVTHDLADLVNYFDSVEFEADWLNHVYELANLIHRSMAMGFVHILIYSNRKYCDVYQLYMELEPFLEDAENVSVFWESSVESMIYHLYLMDRVEHGYLYMFLPYDRNHLSQVENTYLYKLPPAFEKIRRIGWRTVLINPVLNRHRFRSIYIADATFTIRFFDKEAFIELRHFSERIRGRVELRIFNQLFK